MFLYHNTEDCLTRMLRDKTLCRLLLCREPQSYPLVFFFSIFYGALKVSCK